MKKLSKNFYSLSKKRFSIIHNYHSPYQLFSYGKVIEFDEEITNYNKYIQAFLTKRWTHKKEIRKNENLKKAPKIKIIPTDSSYHNTFYTQQSYTMNVLFDIGQLTYMKNSGDTTTAYWLSMFLEDYEKNVIDNVLEKVLVSGRVPFLEDLDNFSSIKKKTDKLWRKFYEGDELTPFEREIERMYLLLKQEKFNINNIEQNEETKKMKKSQVYLTYSEINKIQGHLNFRMHHPKYFFKPRPVFEKIDLELMFKSLFEVRYNSTDKLITKWKLRYQYRDSLLQKPSKVKLLAKYYFLQVFQYTDCYEFLTAFNLGLNFKDSFHILLLHLWLIIQRLKDFTDKDEKKYADFLVNELVDQAVNYGLENFQKFQLFDSSSSKKLSSIRLYVLKIIDSFTFYFKINDLTKENPYYYINSLVNTNVFSGSKKLGDKYLKKMSVYFVEHFFYLKNKSYKEFEQNDFDFSVSRIPRNYKDFVENNKGQFSREEIINQLIEDEEKKKNLMKNFENNAHLLTFKQGKSFYNYLKKRDTNHAINYLIDSYIVLPIENEIHYRQYDYTKSWMYRVAVFMRRELNPTFYNSIGQNEEKEKIEVKKNPDLAWKKKEIKLGLTDFGKFQEKSKIYREKMKEN